MVSFGNNSRCQMASRLTGLRAVSAGLIFASLVVGCGGGGGKAAPQASNEEETTVPKATSNSNSKSSVAGKSTSGSSTNKKSNSGIPYDAFFDDPLGEIANTAAAPTPNNVAKTDNTPAETTPKPADGAAKPAAAGGALAWSDYMSNDELQDEVKKVRNRLATSLNGQGAYNQNFKEIAVDGAVMAALAGIAIEHSEGSSWKANAHYVRDFGFDIAASATGPGKENFDKSKAAYEKLASVFSGSVPADAGDVAAKRPFHETADRSGLMKRIEKAKEWMRLNINNEAKLKSESEAILHEAAIVATFGKVVTTEGYVSADEADYQQYADNLINGAKDVISAAKDQSFQKFTDSINKINKSCSDCHANYGNG